MLTTRPRSPRLLPRALLLLAFAGLAALPAGCAEKPRMRLHHAELRSASLYGVGLNVVLKVDNPNSFDIEIRNVRVTLRFADRYDLPEIVHSPNKWLPSGQSTLVSVPVIIPYALIPPIVRTAASSPTLRYHVKGSADVTALRSLEVEKDDYPIDEDGSIQRSALLAAAGIPASAL